MKYTVLGNSGLIVSRLCLGTMIFGEKNKRGTDEGTAKQMVSRFIDLGGNFIDTADAYAAGVSEQIVGRAIKPYQRNQLVIASKVRMPTGNGPNDAGLSRKHIIEGCEASLKRLGIETIDLYYLHMWDPVTPLEESLRALEDLIRQGKVRYIGVSNFRAWQIMKALGVSDKLNMPRFIAGQFQHSLIVRDIEREFTGLFLEENIGEVVWGPLGGGFLSGKYKPGDKPEQGRIAVVPDHTEEAWHRRAVERNWRILETIGAIAENHGAQYAQIALAWLLATPAVRSIIIGARTTDQLEVNLGSLDIELSKEELDTLNKVSSITPGYPYRMIDEYGKRTI